MGKTNELYIVVFYVNVFLLHLYSECYWSEEKIHFDSTESRFTMLIETTRESLHDDMVVHLSNLVNNYFDYRQQGYKMKQV